jgi:hypothetical protein
MSDFKPTVFKKCSGCKKYFKECDLFIYVDGNNGVITKQSKPHCKDCYKIKYGDK